VFRRTLPRSAAAAVLAAAALLAACGAAAPADEAVDLVLRNGRVYTVDDALPHAEAVAIRGERIVAVGSNAEIDAYVGARTEVMDLAGRAVVPGFIEGHGHFLGLGRARMNLDLTQAHGWNDIVSLVAAAVRDAPAGAWIAGRGWHQERWSDLPADTVDGVPVHTSLSAVSPNNPVLLTHASGHAAFANARALALAGIDRNTPNPPGGEIVRDREGNPTGLLRETAQRAVSAAMSRAGSGRSPEEVEAELRRQVELAGEDALRKGVTSFHDAGASFSDIDFFKRLADEGALPVRLYVMVRRVSNDEMTEKLPQYRTIGYGSDFLTVRSIKRQIDGALGPHGAWLLEPYADMPQSAGLNLEDVDDIRRTAELALQHDFQLNTHAIGDRANRVVLDIYEDAFARHGVDGRDLRWRIEHAQHIDPEDVPRFASLGVIASMQGIHGTSDGPWVLRRLGERRAEEGAYLWRTLIEHGVLVTNGTDAPVEDIDPIASFYASVSRRMADGDVFFPAQRMTREEALYSYTMANAIAAFEEELKGSITPGKLADLVVLSADIMQVPEEQIPGVRVDYTIVGGQTRYRREP
jgi:predicted amidohydrolase YtcJ